MAVHLIDAVTGAIASSADYNANNVEIEATWTAQGPYVVSGLVHSAGTGLSVNVTAGTAVIGGYVSFSSFTISGLANGTLNHIYVLNTGVGTSNTTGTAPANSAKLGTATTAGGVVTSVNLLRSSGRQSLIRPENQIAGDPGSMGSIDLSDWNATAADGFQVFGTLPSGAVPSPTAPLTLTLNDASGSTTTYPLILRHTNSGGVGANGIGTGLQWEAENTGGTVSTIGATRMVTENDISANLTTRWEVEVYQNGAARTMMRTGPTSVRIEQAPAASADFGLLSIGGGGWASGAGNFQGHASGTLLAMNMDAGWAGDWIGLQQDGVEYFRVGATGAIFGSVWNTSNNIVSTALTIRHMSNAAGAGAAGIGTRLEFQAEGDSNDLTEVAAQIDTVLTTATHSAATSRFDVRVNSAGTMVTPFSIAPTAVSLGEAVNLTVGTTTGTKIGTAGGASGQKLGFFNQTPIVQPLLATGAGATVDNVITALQNLGLVRQT